MKLETIKVGRIVNAHGIRGEVRVQPRDADPNFITRFKTFVINGEVMKPTENHVHKSVVLMKFPGVDDMDAALALKDKDIYVRRADAHLGKNEFFDDELLGLQAVTAQGHPVTLPAPLSDINAAIAMGCLSYLVILSGGILSNGIKGVGKTLKEFSLPISMSFRLFGGLLSGALVSELVYYYVQLSFVLPVLVGVMFTLLHALIQTYVLTLLTSLFYGEVSEKKKAE